MKAIFDRIKSRVVLEFKKFFFDDEWYRGYRYGMNEIGRYLDDKELPIAGRMYLVEILQKSVANRQTDWQKGVWDACEFFNEVWKELTDV